MLIENESQRLKFLDEQHNGQLREWRELLKPRKKVQHVCHLSPAARHIVHYSVLLLSVFSCFITVVQR